MSEKECCGTCRWHQHESVDDGWVCVNPDSDGTGYTMSLEEIHKMVDDPNVLQLTITKMTTKEYLKKVGAANENKR